MSVGSHASAEVLNELRFGTLYLPSILLINNNKNNKKNGFLKHISHRLKPNVWQVRFMYIYIYTHIYIHTYMYIHTQFMFIESKVKIYIFTIVKLHLF